MQGQLCVAQHPQEAALFLQFEVKPLGMAKPVQMARAAVALPTSTVVTVMLYATCAG